MVWNDNSVRKQLFFYTWILFWSFCSAPSICPLFLQYCAISIIQLYNKPGYSVGLCVLYWGKGRKGIWWQKAEKPSPFQILIYKQGIFLHSFRFTFSFLRKFFNCVPGIFSTWIYAYILHSLLFIYFFAILLRYFSAHLQTPLI